ncbi:MAG: choice-of-anchor tandem repeat NxxGxxAF-containing protein [Phycisphaerales bacterium JB037]
MSQVITNRSAIVASLLAAGFASADPGSVRVVALSGQPVPGTPPGVTFQFFGLPGPAFKAPLIGDSGAVAFLATLQGPGVGPDNNIALVAYRNNALELVARTGDQAPGAPAGYRFHELDPNQGESIKMNDWGRTVFLARLRDPAGTRRDDLTVWTEGQGSLAPFRFLSPDMPEFFYEIEHPVINDPGTIAFHGIIRQPPGSPAIGGLFTDAGGIPTRVTNLFGTVAGINDDGDVLGTGASGVLLASDDDLTKLVYAGLPVPGAPPDSHIRSSGGNLRLSEKSFAFIGTMEGPHITPDSDRGVMAGPLGNFSLRAREGQPAPGTPDGVSLRLFRDGTGDPDVLNVNASGHVAFIDRLEGPGVNSSNATGIWTDLAGSLSLVAREGDPAPGTERGTIISTIYINFVEYTLAINDRGQGIFGAGVENPNSQIVNARTLWWFDATGNFRVLLRDGDVIDTNPDPASTTLRTIGLLNPNGASLNEQGQVAVRVFFTDGTDAILIAQIPCPADLTGSSDPSDDSFGRPDGDADTDDFLYFLDAFAQQSLRHCDLGSTDQGSLVLPDGICDGDDFFRYLDLFAAGCN